MAHREQEKITIAEEQKRTETKSTNTRDKE
jgi:hypothetical protein